MSSQPIPLLTAEEYLEIERASEMRHEFHAGQMYAMVGASREHHPPSIDCRLQLADAYAKVQFKTG